MPAFVKKKRQLGPVLPLLEFPAHIIERIVDKMSLDDMITFRECSTTTKQIVDGYWQRRRVLSTSPKDIHRLFPYIDGDQVQFESMFQIRNELGRLLRMTPANRLIELDFSGLRRFHRQLLEDVIIRNNLSALSLFSGVTRMSFNGCLVSCADLESLSYCMQNLKLLTLSDRLIDHQMDGEEIEPLSIQNFRAYQKNGLIGHRARTIAYLKTLWPTLVHLTFV